MRTWRRKRSLALWSTRNDDGLKSRPVPSILSFSYMGDLSPGSVMSFANPTGDPQHKSLRDLQRVHGTVFAAMASWGLQFHHPFNIKLWLAPSPKPGPSLPFHLVPASPERIAL
ncbi:hypothetical protein TrVFT333_001547 [Trichoderma virens FT-333]|nr:hypothetical protein TrVFT333_001547 [Trichoderma virens FT-333]